MTYVEKESAMDSLCLRPAFTPPYVQRLGMIAAEQGFASAVNEVFDDAGITIATEADLSEAAGKGLLLASDHGQRLEPLLVQGLMQAADRQASHVIAMPTSFAGKQMQASGPEGKSLILPVIPRQTSGQGRSSMARLRSRVRHELYPQVLKLPEARKHAISDQSLSRAAGIVAEAGTVTIFPTAGSADSARARWYKGIGSIAQRIPEVMRPETLVAVMRPDTFSVPAVMSALAMRDLGLKPKKQTIVLRAAVIGSVHEVAGSDADSCDAAAALRIARFIGGVYRQYFGV